MYYTYPIPSTFEYVVPPSLGQTHIGISILVGCERNCSLIAQLHTAFVVLCKVLRKKNCTTIIGNNFLSSELEGERRPMIVVQFFSYQNLLIRYLCIALDLVFLTNFNVSR